MFSAFRHSSSPALCRHHRDVVLSRRVQPSYGNRFSWALAVALVCNVVALQIPCKGQSLAPARQQKEPGVVDSKDKETEPSDLAELDANIQECESASEAVLLCQLFLADDTLASEVRDRVEERLAFWKDREANGYVRFGKEWLAGTSAAARREESRNCCAAGLALLRLARFQLSEKEFEKAGRLDPSASQPEFFIGLVDEIIRKDSISAMRHFKAAARRQPNYWMAWNNAAISGLRGGRTTNVTADFQQALLRSEGDDRKLVANNMARVLARGRLNSRHLADLTVLYKDAVTVFALEPFDVLRADQETDNEYVARLTPKIYFNPLWGEHHDKNPDAQPQDGIIGVAYGTGFFVDNSHIVTNHHVVEGHTLLQVRDPKDNKRFFAATLLDADPIADLALLSCDEIDCEGLSIQSLTPGRGTEVMALGFPGGLLEPGLGIGLKSTRGSVVTEPEDYGEASRFLFDAIVNQGNSGGPLVDKTGSVVGVVVEIRGLSMHNQYSAAVPIEDLTAFLGKNQITLRLADSNRPELKDWENVDTRASPCTVLIKNIIKASSN